MENKVRIALAVTGVAIVAYTLGHQKGQTQTIKLLGNAVSNEAVFFLATQDFIKNRLR